MGNEDLILEAIDLVDEEINKSAFDILVYMFEDIQSKMFPLGVEKYILKNGGDRVAAETEVRDFQEQEFNDFINVLCTLKERN